MPAGYGMLQHEGRLWYAHRLAYSLAIGPIPEGCLICHHCDQRLCINPSHLFAGSPADNTQDAIAKGRIQRGAHGRFVEAAA
jgi:Autographiviridae endonuclease